MVQFREMFRLLLSANMTLPAMEVSLLLALLTCCLVFRFTRTGLITAYLFTYRWGFVFFVGYSQDYLVTYVGFGFVVGILTVVGMLRRPSDD